MNNFTIDEDKSEARIYRYLTDVDKDFIPSLSERVDVRDYAKKLSLKAINLFASIDGNDVAHASFYANNSCERRAFLTSISVKSEIRGQGLSHALMYEVLLRSRNAGMREIRLEVDSKNIGAVRFYKKEGFEFFDDSDSVMFLILE